MLALLPDQLTAQPATQPATQPAAQPATQPTLQPFQILGQMMLDLVTMSAAQEQQLALLRQQIDQHTAADGRTGRAAAASPPTVGDSAPDERREGSPGLYREIPGHCA